MSLYITSRICETCAQIMSLYITSRICETCAQIITTDTSSLHAVSVDNDSVESLGAESTKTRLSQIAHNMAVHAVSGLNSMDNVTVVIVLLRGGPASCPLDLSALATDSSNGGGKYEDTAIDDDGPSAAPRWTGDLRNSRPDDSGARSSATQLPRQQPADNEHTEQGG